MSEHEEEDRALREAFDELRGREGGFLPPFARVWRPRERSRRSAAPFFALAALGAAAAIAFMVVIAESPGATPVHDPRDLEPLAFLLERPGGAPR